jgi:N-acyl-D-aspartate/D-glutamate deacylase
LHVDPKPQQVLIHMNPDDVVDTIMRDPRVMVASDGQQGHPRNAGTFSRFLARYVRGQRSVTLVDAVRKLSLMPAQRLERSTALARRKGRIQAGADADIVVFDLEHIEDRATFSVPAEASIGVKYLIVGGTIVVDNGQFLESANPGQALAAEGPAPVRPDGRSNQRMEPTRR